MLLLELPSRTLLGSVGDTRMDWGAIHGNNISETKERIGGLFKAITQRVCSRKPPYPLTTRAPNVFYLSGKEAYFRGRA